MTAVEHCENCGEAIGKLETPCVWQGSVVCVRCHGKLSAVPIDVDDDLRSAALRQTDAQRFLATARHGTPTIKRPRSDAKQHQVGGSMVAVLGVLLATVAFRYEQRELGAIGIVVLLIGLLWFSAGRFMER